MGETTAIEWATATWNPWHGCLKVSPGCKFCYMYREKIQYGQRPEEVVRSKTTFRDPLKWRTPQARVFTCSWSDFFIEQADAWRPEAWEIIRSTPQHTYLILTKRIERVPACLPPDWGGGYRNVWLGVSVENQHYADQRIPQLLAIPAAVRWISAEPLLDSITLLPWLDVVPSGMPRIFPLAHTAGVSTPLLDWIVVGGESGPVGRPFDIRWALRVLGDCRTAGVPVFIKQLGRRPMAAQIPIRLRDLEGRDPNDWPDNLRVREFPGVRSGVSK